MSFASLIRNTSRALLCPIPRLLPAVVLSALGIASTAQAQSGAPISFFIEAEDFNFNRGQSLPAASVIPYLGGAYVGLSNAVSTVDYSRTSNSISPLYRNDRRIPIAASSDLQRDGVSVTPNFRLSELNGGEWFNYTRNLPPGKYLAYAAMSHQDVADDLLQGSISIITSAATNNVQTVVRKGSFKAPGTGSWDTNRLVGLKDTAGRFAILDLGSNSIIRFTATKGWLDYMKFVTARPPVISNQPTDVTVIENTPATFSLTLGSDDFAAIQWQTNQVNVLRATNTSFSFVPTLAYNGAQVRCVLTNTLGTNISDTVTLRVQPDTVRPVAVRAMNLGNQVIRIFFSESVSVPAGAASANFSVSGGIQVTSVSQPSDANSLDITLSTALAYDTAYVVTLSGVPDIAATPNLVLPNSTIAFTSVQYVATDIGRPGVAGSLTRVPGGFDVTGAGSDVGPNSDQFEFSWEPKAGDFDLQVRVASALITDSFLHAGLMARETLATNAPFAASFASSAQLGCFFKTRKTVGAAVTTSSFPGGVPVNYPDTWLRLRRVGNILSGFASLDGRSWALLGTNSYTTLSNTLLVGFALSSQSSTLPTRVEFRDIGPTASPNEVSSLPDRETLGATSRRTGLVFSEVMYHPRQKPGITANLEFIEIYNAGAIFDELKGYKITGGITYNFPDNLIIRPGQFLVIAADPAAVEQEYGITGVLGPWTGTLNNSGDTIELKDGRDAMKLQMTYDSKAPWPVAADGAGASLVLTRPSYGEDSPKAWSASRLVGGSPGQMDSLDSSRLRSVVINEFLANTAAPQSDFVELYNHSNDPVDLSGSFLTDDASTNKFRIPEGTTIPARGFLSFDESILGFGLNASGEAIYLIDPTSTRIIDAVSFGGQEAGVSSGRYPDGSADIRRLRAVTPGAANALWRVEDVVINEIMYAPITQNSADEYIELYNRSAAPVNLGGWRFTAGINFVIPAGTTLAPNGYLVIAKDAARLIARNPQLSAANTLGNYSGTLANSGERVALARPASVASAEGQPANPPSFDAVVTEVTYGVAGRWGKWSNGGGSSLELIDARADLLQASSWADSDETAKAPWTDLSITNSLFNGNPAFAPNRLHVSLHGPGECLVDEVDLRKVGSTNLVLNGNFQSTNTSQKWELFGNHSNSTIDTNGGFEDSRCLHVRSSGDGDTGVNSNRRNLQPGLTAGNTASISAKVRWLAGWPEILFRLHGSWLELPGRMTVPTNLGTPGLPNSRKVANGGPAISSVNHAPALPRASQPVLVTCQVEDTDGLASVMLRYRYDPVLTLTNVVMRDDGTGGDAIAGDGIYSGIIPGRASGVAAFRIEATDAAASAATSVFPASAPVQECLIRWGEVSPFGTFQHYHLWSTAATEAARGGSTALNNTFRDATLVQGNGRIIYNAGFRDKGSPFHGGVGDFAVTVPDDDILMGARDRVFGATGNGGSEDTGVRGRTANWFQREMGLPYLHAHYILFYRNGSLHQSVSEDAEQPSNPYAEAWYPSGEPGELFKIAVWFEDDATDSNTQATMEAFRTPTGALDLKRYRWNWQLRANDSANNYTNFFNLVETLNASGDYVPGMLALADMQEWMRVFAYHRVMGNWDSWTYNVGQNMFIYRQPGAKWVLIPWDIDFVLGLGGAPQDPLWGGQDPVANTRIYDNFTFRRMLYQAFQDAIAGPMQPSRYGPQIEARRLILAKNKIALSSPATIGTDYIDPRREFLRSEIAKVDVSGLSITNNAGSNYVSSTSVTTIAGSAPFAVATIEINGVPYPVKWTGYTSYAIQVPLNTGANVLNLVGYDQHGKPVPGASDTITAIYNGVPQQAKDFVEISEIHYNPLEPRASFVELYNRSTTTPFDLSGFQFGGLSYTFPEGSLIAANSYLILAKSKAGFSIAYGSTIPVWDEFGGSLSDTGERLALIKPGATPDLDVVVSEVRYEGKAPWPVAPNGTGPSLQLIDPTRDVYRVGNWAATAADSLNRVTPGRTNSVRQSIAAFPLLWINEVLPSNQSGPTDNAGQRDPYIELYNSGATTLDLSAYYLTDTYTNLTRWQFPAGTTLGPKQFLLVWADGDVGQTVAGVPHTNFRLTAGTGSVALVRMQGSPAAPAVMDYMNYSGIPVDRGLGDYPDGEPRNRQLIYFVTPGATNNPVFPDVSVTINEVMASNQKTITDTANGKFSDWVELYNGGNAPVDLTGYRLTDTLTNKTQFVIPAGYVIPAKGFLLVWADGDPALNSPSRPDLHVNFKLAETGEEIGLYAPDDRLVDGFAFGAQIADFSLGRYPDGAAAPLIYMPTPTPRKKNDLTHANLPPTVTAVAERTVPEMVPMSVQIVATDPNPGQTLSYSLTGTVPSGVAIHPATGLLTWTPGEDQGPGNYVIRVLVTDDGLPASSVPVDVSIRVTEVNQAPLVTPMADQDLVFGKTLRFTVDAIDPDIPAQSLGFTLPVGNPLGAGVHPQTGGFTWTPSFDQIGDHVVTILTTDNGVPPLTTPMSFKVHVREPDPVPAPVIAFNVAPNGEVTLYWPAVEGVIYRVEYKEHLSDATWLGLQNVLGVNGTASITGLDTAAQPERYYRVVVQQ